MAERLLLICGDGTVVAALARGLIARARARFAWRWDVWACLSASTGLFAAAWSLSGFAAGAVINAVACGWCTLATVLTWRLDHGERGGSHG
jgi:hypothetical protein